MMNLEAAEPLLLQLYRDFNARDIEPVIARMHPDVDWPNGMEGGRVYGHDGVRTYWTRQFALVHMRVLPTAFSEEGDGRIVVRVDQAAVAADGSLSNRKAIEHVYRFRDGLIDHMEIRPLT